LSTARPTTMPLGTERQTGHASWSST
jgi:hypothetical protein